MIYYLKTKAGDVICVNAVCSHPDMVGNNAASVGCDANCHGCRYCTASMVFSYLFKLVSAEASS